MAFESSEDSQKEGIGKLTGPELLCIELLFHLLESETRKNIWDSGDNLYGADPHPGMKNKGKTNGNGYGICLSGILVQSRGKCPARSRVVVSIRRIIHLQKFRVVHRGASESAACQRFLLGAFLILSFLSSESIVYNEYEEKRSADGLTYRRRTMGGVSCGYGYNEPDWPHAPRAGRVPAAPSRAAPLLSGIWLSPAQYHY